MLLTQNRKSLVSIYLNDAHLSDQSSPCLYAAKELQYYLGRITAAPFRIAPLTDGITGIRIDLETSLGEDGFRIVSDGGDLRITGGSRGVIYGVYEFLEELGCRFFTHNCEKIPTLPTLSVRDDYDLTGAPAFEYREHNYADAVGSPRFSVKCRFNGAHHRIPKHMGGSMDYAWFVHTFDRMVPVETYGKTHPEYYALVNGKRNAEHAERNQLCLSNEEVLHVCTEAVRKRLRERPDTRLISISQNDWPESCQCENCRRIDEAEGSPGGTLLRFVNRIAEALESEFPDVIFDTLAYQYTRPAPRLTHNRKNVCVRLCSIEACFAHPFESCDDEARMLERPDGTKTNFISDLRDWGRICDRIYIWDYTTCFAHYPTPHPNWRVLQPNLQAMYRNNVKGVFEQANGASRGGVDFNELRMYLISKLLWDPFCDIAAHRKEFMEYFYGDAAPMLEEYLDLICDTVEKENIHVGFNDNPTHAFLREELLDRYDALFDRAADAVRGDPLRLWRVEKNRLSIRWVRLKRATMLRGEYDPEQINRFFTDWRAYNLSRIDEWCNHETTHRALLDGLWRGTEYFDHWTGEEPEIL